MILKNAEAYRGSGRWEFVHISREIGGILGFWLVDEEGGRTEGRNEGRKKKGRNE